MPSRADSVTERSFISEARSCSSMRRRRTSAPSGCTTPATAASSDGSPPRACLPTSNVSTATTSSPANTGIASRCAVAVEDRAPLERSACAGERRVDVFAGTPDAAHRASRSARRCAARSTTAPSSRSAASLTADEQRLEQRQRARQPRRARRDRASARPAARRSSTSRTARRANSRSESASRGRERRGSRVEDAEGAERVAERVAQRRAGVEAHARPAVDERRVGEAAVVARVADDEQIVALDGVVAEGDRARQRAAREARDRLGPPAALVDEADGGDRRVEALARDRHQLVERALAWAADDPDTRRAPSAAPVRVPATATSSPPPPARDTPLARDERAHGNLGCALTKKS